jgi:hypothetical protein
MDWKSRAWMSWFALIAALALICVQAAARVSEPAAGKLRLERAAETALIYSDDRPVAEYRFVESPRKPYVSRLFSPAGVQVLRDSPSDHKHHHALMFALSASKINFWEEAGPDAGIEKPVSPIRDWQYSRRAIDAGGLIQELEWLDPGAAGALLQETRTIAALQGSGISATLLLWRSRLQTAAGRASVELGGAHYFGLGMRFVTDMDTGGTFLYPDGAQSEVVRGTERLTAARWTAYSANAGGKTVTVALFDHPANRATRRKCSPCRHLSPTWRQP